MTSSASAAVIGAQDLSAQPPALSIRRLKFRYDVSRQKTASADFVVDVAALTLRQGEQMLLSGASGQGKSTLLHVIAGLMDPQQGEVRVAGQLIHQLSGAARDQFRGRHIGMIFQTFNLMHGFSAVENVMAAMMFADTRVLPRRSHRTRAVDLLRQLGIEQVDTNPDRLSVGQQQRVAVARAIACEPELVLADEPTASLDPANAAAAMDLIQETCARHHAALLCVSHDPAIATRFVHQKGLHELHAGLQPEAG